MYNIQRKTTATPALGQAAKLALLDLSLRMRYVRELDDCLRIGSGSPKLGIISGVINSSTVDYVVGSHSLVSDLTLAAPLSISVGSLTWLSKIDLHQGAALRSAAYDFDEPSDTVAWLESDEAIPLFLHEAPKFSHTLADLKGLFHEDDSDGCTFKPTPHAFELAVSFLIFAAERLGSEFPRPNVVSDGDGGIRLRWVAGNRDVRLLLASSDDRKPRLYHEKDGVYKIERDVTPHDFTRWLRWLINDEGIARAA